MVSDLYLQGGQYKAVEILGNFARRSIRLRDLVIDSGEDLISLFRVLYSQADDALVAFNASPAIFSAARTIGYLCFGSPPPPFDKVELVFCSLRSIYHRHLTYFFDADTRYIVVISVETIITNPPVSHKSTRASYRRKSTSCY